MTLSNLLSPLMVIADRFVISSIVGAGVVAYYTVPNEFLIRLLVIPAALTTSLFPVFSQTLSSTSGQIRTLYFGALKTIAIFMFPILAATATGAHFAISLWLGKDFAENSYVAVIVLSLGILFNSFAQIPHAAIQANGNAKQTSIIHLCEFVIYAPTIYLLVTAYGIVGAAIAWTGRAFIDLAALHYFAMVIIEKKSNRE